MATISRLVAELDMETDGYDAGLKHAKKEAGALKKFFGSALSTATGFVAANVVGKGFDLVTSNIGSTITAASDLNESMSAVRTVFGDAAGDVAGFSGSVAKNLGLSRQEALQVATVFGAMGQQIGLTGTELSGFSNDMAQAGADLASFYNVPVPEALAAIQSGLQGEADPLRRFGIFLSDAELNAYAMAKGINKSTQEMSEQEKILLRQNYIMDHLGAAQGDFARTSGGLANQQRILRARLDDLRASIGQKLLPVMLKITDAANRFLARFDKKRLQGIPAFQALMSSLHTTLNQTFGKETGTKIYKTLRGIVTAVRATAKGVSVAIKIITEIVKGLAPIVSAVAKTIATALRPIIVAFGNAVTMFRKVRAAGYDMFTSLQVAMGAFFLGLNTGIPIIDQFVGYISRSLSRLVAAVREVVALVRAVIDGDWAEAWQRLKNLAQIAFDQYVDYLKTGVELAREAFRLILDAIRDVDWGDVADFLTEQGARLIVALYEAARDFLTGTVLPWLRRLPGIIADATPDLIGTLLGHGEDLLRGLWRGVSGFWNDVVKRWFSKIGQHVKDQVPMGELLGTLRGAGESILGGLWNGVTWAWDNLVKPFFSNIGRAIGAITPAGSDLLKALLSAGKSIINGLKNGIDEAWKNVKDFFSGIDDTISGILPSAADFEAAFGVITKPLETLKTIAEGVVGTLGDIAGWFGKGGGDSGDGTSQPAQDAQGISVSFDPGDSLGDIQEWAEDVGAALEPLAAYLVFASGQGGATTNMQMQAPPFKGEASLTAVKRWTKSVTDEFKRMNLAAAEQMRALKANADIQFASMGTTVRNRTTTMRNSVANAFVGMRNDAAQLAASLRNAVVAQFASMAARAGGSGEGETNALRVSVRNAFQSMRDDASNAAESLRNRVVNEFVGMRNNAVSLAESMRFGVVNQMVGMRNEAASVAAGLGGRVADAIYAARDAANNAAGSFYYVGQNIAVGIRNGIRDTAGIIADAAASAVNNAINAANQAAQISSPSRRTMYTGAMIAEGMAVGISRGVPSVQRAGSNLANAAFVVPGSAAAGGGGFGGGGGRAIINYGTIGIEDPDPRRIKDATHAQLVGLARA